MKLALKLNPLSSGLARRLVRARWFMPLIKIVVSGTLIWLVLSGIDFASLAKTISGISLWVFAGAAALVLAQLLALAYRWCLVLRHWQVDLALSRAFRLCYIGLFFNQALPGAIGGDAVRIWQAERGGVPLRRAVNSVLLERIIGVYGQVFLIAVTAPWIWASITGDHFKYMIYTIGAGTTLAVFLLAVGDRLVIRSWRNTPLLGKLLTISVDMRSLICAPKTFVMLLVLSAVSAAVGLASMHLVVVDLGLELSLMATLCLTSIAVLATMVPVSIAGWGVREAAMVLVFQQVGVGPEPALILSLFFGLLMVAISLPGGLIWVRTRAAPA